jgi:glycosyltransferase involved in cell wall biosynthesis
MARMLSELPPPPVGKTGWPWTTETAPSIYGPRRSWPKLTVVTPSFNQGRFIEETIRSVLLQNYPNLEYFVIDGGSSDQSVEIIEKYSPWIDYWVSEKDGGQGNAINKGFAKATGELLGWLNSDDAYYPDAFGNIIRSSVDLPEYVAYVGSCDRVTPAGELLSTVKPRNLTAEGLANWFLGGFFYQPACFFRRDVFERVGQVCEKYENAMDVELWMRLVTVGEFRALDEKIAYAKIHPDMKTTSNVPRRDAETVAVAISHGYPEAAVNRMNAFAKHYLRTQASERMLIHALVRKIRSRLSAFLP